MQAGGTSVFGTSWLAWASWVKGSVSLLYGSDSSVLSSVGKSEDHMILWPILLWNHHDSVTATHIQT